MTNAADSQNVAAGSTNVAAGSTNTAVTPVQPLAQLPSQKDKVWFITGSSSGFGRLLAELVLSLGGSVVATARSLEKLTELTKQYPATLQLHELDVTSQQSIDDAVGAALARFERVDVLVNNAGYGVIGAIEEVGAIEYGPMYATNVFGLIDVTKALLPQFRARGSGSIVNLSSIGGLIGGAGFGYYASTKFAVEGLSESLAAELKPFGVHVMVVEPGPFRTDFLGRSAQESKNEIPGYRQTAGKAREYNQTQAGKQQGDPQKAVEAMVQAVSAAEPPSHLLLGNSALDRYRAKLKTFSEEMERWEPVTRGADFAE
jgi:NAD(P)-dependent dehydrogenase (short-subunit alcohol dehydrogenase family)